MGRISIDFRYKISPPHPRMCWWVIAPSGISKESGNWEITFIPPRNRNFNFSIVGPPERRSVSKRQFEKSNYNVSFHHQQFNYRQIRSEQGLGECWAVGGCDHWWASPAGPCDQRLAEQQTANWHWEQSLTYKKSIWKTQ